jgi:glycosyltransferase involved in cell wall biosynthesis
MRIAVVAPPWLSVPPGGYGGIEVVVDALCRGLAAAGHEVLLCASGDSTCPVALMWTYERAQGTASLSPAVELRHVIAAYEAIAMWEPDIVHDHTLMGPFYSERYGHLPIVATNHGPFDSDLTVVYRAMASRVPIVAISFDQAARANDIPICAVIHHGVDLSQLPLGGGHGNYALFLGRMCATKGVDVAIRAARAAGVPLRIAAKMREPAEYEYFANVVKPLLDNDVEFVGEAVGAAKLQLLSDAICLINPIAWPEPFGMVMVEALACGTPVIAAPIGAAPEIVDEGVTGYLCRDARQLIDALAKVGSLDRSLCRTAVELRFTSGRMVADHVVLYERLVASHDGCRLDVARPVAGAFGSYSRHSRSG